MSSTQLSDEQQKAMKFDLDMINSIQNSVSKGQWTAWKQGDNVDVFLRALMTGVRQSASATERITQTDPIEKETFGNFMDTFEEVQAGKTTTEHVVALFKRDPASQAKSETDVFGTAYAKTKFLKTYDAALHAKILDQLNTHPQYSAIEIATSNLRERAGMRVRETSGLILFAEIKRTMVGESDLKKKEAKIYIRDGVNGVSNRPTNLQQVNKWMETIYDQWLRVKDQMTESELCEIIQQSLLVLFPVGDFPIFGLTISGLVNRGNEYWATLHKEVLDALNVTQTASPDQVQKRASLMKNVTYTSGNWKNKWGNWKKWEDKPQHQNEYGKDAKGKYGKPSKGAGKGKDGGGKSGKDDKGAGKGKTGGGKTGGKGGKGDKNGKGKGKDRKGKDSGCFLCGSKDHWARDCPQNKTGNQYQD